MSVTATAWSVDDRTAVAPGKLLSLLVALAYGLLLVSLPLLGLQDRLNYMDYATDSLALLGANVLAGPLITLANAPLWLLLNGSLGLLLSPENVLRVIIFAQAVVIAYLLVRADRKNWLWLIVFLFMPRLLENYTVHLRQGCGITVFMAGWFCSNKFWKCTFMGMAPFVHESFAFVVPLYVLVELMKKLRLAEDVRTTVIAAAGLLVGVGLTVLASLFGARQLVEYNLEATSVSGAAFLLWLVILGLILLEGPPVTKKYAIAVAGIVFYLCTYFLIGISGRIFESLFAIILLCGLQLTGWRRVMFLWMTVVSGALGWVMAIVNPTISFF